LGNGGRQNYGEGRMRRVRQGAGANSHHSYSRDEAFGTRRIDQRSTGHLADEGNESSRREHKSDVDLCPFLRSQINRNKRPEAGLYVGHKEDEPVEAAEAA
jgi:hypothetical protein